MRGMNICPRNHVVLVDGHRLTLEEIKELSPDELMEYNRLVILTLGGKEHLDI